MQSDLGRLYLDGENIPQDRLIDIYQPPPDIPQWFFRSALVVGPRGSGKTTLFRYHETVHEGFAHRVKLLDIFGSLAREAGVGGLRFVFDEALTHRLSAKSTAL